MFVPTGWHDWELVMAALLYAWAVLAVVSLFAFTVAYGLFWEHPRAVGTSALSQAGQGIASTVSPSTVYVAPTSHSPAAVAIPSESSRESV